MTDDEYAELLDLTTSKAAAKTEELIAEYVDWSQDFDVIREQLKAIYSTIVEAYGEAASFLAAEKYDVDRRAQEIQGQYQAHLIETKPKYPRKPASDAIGTYIESGPEAAARTMGVAASHAVKNIAHQTVVSNAAKDKSLPRYTVRLRCQLGKCRKKNKPAWHCDNVARMVENLEAGEKPDNWFHANCTCTVTANWTDGKTRWTMDRNRKDAEILNVEQLEEAGYAPLSGLVRPTATSPITASSSGGDQVPPRRPPTNSSEPDPEPNEGGYFTSVAPAGKAWADEYDRSEVKKLRQWEIDTAERLRYHGYSTTFRPATGDGRRADALLKTANGENGAAEFTAPTGSGPQTIINRLKDKAGQSSWVVLDLIRSPLTIDEVMAQVRRASVEAPTLKRVTILTKDNRRIEWRSQ